MQHIILFIGWLLYGAMHSFLATSFVKQRMEAFLKSNYKYYRFAYSVFATLALIALLWWHISVASFLLWHSGMAEKIVALFTGATGLGIMLACVKGYFFEMMGLYAFSKKQPGTALITGGIHKYIRHPLYTGTLLFLWAFFIYEPSLKNLVTCGANTLYLMAGIQLEEQKLRSSFGESYRQYAARTPMLFPRMW